MKLWSDPLVLCYQVFFTPHIYWLRSLTQQGNNALGSISLSVNPSVLSHMNRLSVHLGDHLIINHEAGRCLSVCLSVHPSIRVCVCVLFTLKQKWLLPVQDFVCNLGALADNIMDVVDQLLIWHRVYQAHCKIHGTAYNKLFHFALLVIPCYLSYVFFIF